MLTRFDTAVNRLSRTNAIGMFAAAMLCFVLQITMTMGMATTSTRGMGAATTAMSTAIREGPQHLRLDELDRYSLDESATAIVIKQCLAE